MVARRRRQLKKYIVDYMGGKCHRCGWNEHQSGLVPHHVDPNKKSFGLSTGGKTVKWKALEEECKKCILLCNNCHNVVHALNMDFYFNPENIPDYGTFDDPTAHGRPKINKNCLDCGTPVSPMAYRCRSCTGRANALKGHKIDWPPVEELIKRIKNSSYLNVAKELGVSDNGLRKHIKIHSKLENV